MHSRKRGITPERQDWWRKKNTGLKNGAITELKLVVKDENNTVVDNHGLPMSCVLEII